MKIKEDLKKYRAMDENKLTKEVKRLQDDIQNIRLKISAKKTSAFDKSKKARVKLAQALTTLNQKKVA